MPLTWRELRDYTRLRRKQAATTRVSVNDTAARHRLKYAKREAHGTYIAHELCRGLILDQLTDDLWTFQNGHCYICVRIMCGERLTTREHVHPRARGGQNTGNILLACQPCNNAKSDRLPTTREVLLLDAWNRRDRADWNRWITALDRDLPPL